MTVHGWYVAPVLKATIYGMSSMGYMSLAYDAFEVAVATYAFLKHSNADKKRF